MYFELQLAKGKRAARGKIRLNERGERLELPTLDVDFEDVDVRVTCMDIVLRTEKEREEGREGGRHVPFIFMRLSNVYILGVSSAPWRSVPARPNAWKCVRLAWVGVICGPKELTVKS
jgi:hypothetical protein